MDCQKQCQRHSSRMASHEESSWLVSFPGHLKSYGERGTWQKLPGCYKDRISHPLGAGDWKTTKSVELFQNGPIWLIFGPCKCIWSFLIRFGFEGRLSIGKRVFPNNRISGTLPEWPLLIELLDMWVLSISWDLYTQQHVTEIWRTTRSTELFRNGPVTWRSCRTCEKAKLWGHSLTASRNLKDNQISGTLPEWPVMKALDFMWESWVSMKLRDH